MTDTLQRPSTTGQTPAERASLGRVARRSAPRQSHAGWEAPTGRRDPVGVLEEQATSRVPELVPIRYGRMLQSPFAFYRGAAAVMSMDLAGTARSGFEVQACGDAHASNFGVFATPEREMVFDVNDFDETARGPWEWDLKRLITSLAIAGRQRGLSTKERRSVLLATSATYRQAMRDFAKQGHLAVWYARLDAQVITRWRSQLAKEQIDRTRATVEKARGKDSTRAVARLTERTADGLRFISDPPLVVPVADLFPVGEAKETLGRMGALLSAYTDSLRPELRRLIRSYQVVDMARKVVGVGSVGTRAWVVLLVGRDPQDGLVLQAKEAQTSVIEAYAGGSPYPNHGQRVVVGQRSMQSVSDILLGWLRAAGTDNVERDYYVRQLWDGKGSADPAVMLPNGLRVYGSMCAWTLARAHARTGDRVAIGAYVGSSDALDRALASFAETYADQNERDHRALADAARTGRVSVQAGL
jgi:uncharacterized protein (DUF2252 family)